MDRVPAYHCRVNPLFPQHGEDGAIRATVVDDGRGGADPSGSGLQGLADRLATTGGRLRVESPRGGGRTVIAAIRASTAPR